MSDAISTADKEDLRIALAMFRALRGWSQAELAGATGLGPSAVSRYESGTQEPSLRTFDRIATAVGLRPSLVRSLLTWIHRARAEVQRGAFPDDMDDFIETSAQNLAEAFSGLLRRALAEMQASEDLAQEESRSAESLWEELKDVPMKDWEVLIEAVRDLQSWQFCTLLCDKSVEAAGSGNAAEALELARLAVHSARMSQDLGLWKLRVKGWALAHLAAALQASGDLPAAVEAVQEARALWDIGDEGPVPLDEKRLLDLESSLLAERSEA